MYVGAAAAGHSPVRRSFFVLQEFFSKRFTENDCKKSAFGKKKMKKRVVHAKNVSFMQKFLNNLYKNTMLFIGNF